MDLDNDDSTSNGSLIADLLCIKGSSMTEGSTDNDNNKGEEGDSGVMLAMGDGDGDVVATTSTGGSGNYKFCSLAPGSYEEVPEDYSPVKDYDGGNPPTEKCQFT